jgi:flagellar protein FlaJ
MKSNILFRIYTRFGTEGYKNWVKKNLAYADISWSVEKFVALAYLYSFSFQIASIILSTVFFSLSGILAFIISAIVFVVVFAIFHLTLIVIADNRAKAVEQVIPDMLKLMSMNLKSGMTVDRALLLSARSEFGIMESEIKNVAKKVISGIPVESALRDITKKIKSKMLERTFKLITEGLEKGGELASLLDQLADDIVNTNVLKKEVAAQVGMYAIFIFFAAGIGAPLLYSVSTTLIQSMVKISSMTNLQPVPQTQVGTIQLKKIEIDVNMLIIYELSALVITSLFGGMLIGLLKEGTEKAGIKIVPILLILNFVIFFVTTKVLTSFIPI